MAHRPRFATIILHTIAILNFAALILLIAFGSDLLKPAFVLTMTTFGLALLIAVELTAWGLKKHKRWAWYMSLCLCALYPLAILLPIGTMTVWGVVPAITFACKSGLTDCTVLLIPLTKLCRSNIFGDCRLTLVSLAKLCKSGVIDCRAELLTLLPMADGQMFHVKIGEYIGPDKPEPGAGRIEKAGTVHRYMFSVDPGTTLVLKAESPCTLGAAHYELHDVGTLVASQTIGGNSLCAGIERTVLEKGGTYTLSVSAEETGEYAFMLQRLTDDNQSFTIKIGDHVAPGKPLSGAGRIEAPGSVDRYTFTAEAGTRVALTAEPPCSNNFYSSLDDPSYKSIMNCYTTRHFLLKHTGPHTIIVSGSTADTGDYGFVLKLPDRLVSFPNGIKCYRPDDYDKTNDLDLTVRVKEIVNLQIKDEQKVERLVQVSTKGNDIDAQTYRLCEDYGREAMDKETYVKQKEIIRSWRKSAYERQ